ncbi:GOLPH3/VPS74 family protein [Micromonospora zhanjiangensis]|uniref:GPP34 family phosphoprotein n=1 Tax=Micromonospora zhanjiangensis TaxID=1522057 RepID=A0ABV8KXD4_9ACTN
MGEKPMSVRDDLLIVDDLMLLLMDDDGVSIQAAGTLHYALGGAVLTELALLGRIQTHDSGVLNGPRVTPSGAGPLPDPLLQSAYDTIAEKTQRVQPLLVTLGADLWRVVLDRLVDRGLLHPVRPEEAQLRARIRRILEDGEAPDPRTAAIIGLLFASGAIPSLRPPLPWTSTTVTRASEIGRGHWGSQAVATAVTRTAAAIVAASAARQRGDYHQVSAQVDSDDPGSTPPLSYLVHVMGHAWPGPAGDGLFIDRAGPDASAIIWDFAQRHPKGSPA